MFVLLTGLSFYFLYQAPVLGIKAAWSEESRAWKIVSGASPFRTADILVSIEGRPIGFHEWLTDNIHIQSRSELFAWLKAKREMFGLMSKPSVKVILVRDDKLIEIQAPIRQAQFSFLTKIDALHWVIGGAFFLIGLIVFWKRGREETDLVFFLMCMAMTLTFVTNAVSMVSETVYSPAWFALMNLLNVPNPMAIGAFMLHFSLLMPDKRPFLVRFPWVVWPFYGFCAVIELTLSIGLMNLVFPVFFLGSVAVMGRYFFRCRDPIKKQQLKWVFAGFGSGLLPFVLINGVPMILTGQRLVNDTIPGLFLIFIPLFTAFAIQKFHLMDIDSLFDNTLVYGATFGVLTAVDLVVAGLFTHLLPGRATSSGFAGGILGLWLVVIAYAPVRNRLRQWFDRLLKRERYDFHDVSTRLSAMLILAPDTPAALTQTETILRETLHPDGASVCLFAQQGNHPVVGEPVPHLSPDAVGVLQTLEGATHLYSVLPKVSEVFGYESGAMLPLIGQSSTFGCIILKNKTSKKPYSRKDLSLLNMVGRQLSLALQNITARETALAKERESQEIKERISREMHDGIGGTFSNALMMLDLICDGRDGFDARSNRVTAMRETLSDGLSDVRALITTMEETEAVMGDMKDSIEGRVRRLLAGRDMECRFTAEIENYDKPLSPLLVHNITKIVQEAVINALKHSQARRIDVALRERDGTLSVHVSDDGKGLAPAASSSGRYGLRNMERRCAEIGADLKVDSRPGEGLEIAVLLTTGGPPRQDS